MAGPIATFIVRSSELNAMNQREKQATRAGHAKLGYLFEYQRDTIRFAGNNGRVLIQRLDRAVHISVHNKSCRGVLLNHSSIE